MQGAPPAMPPLTFPLSGGCALAFRIARNEFIVLNISIHRSKPLKNRVRPLNRRLLIDGLGLLYKRDNEAHPKGH
jgi:hypothetical protein